MKFQYLSLPIIILFSILSACQPPVVFDQPYPINKPNMNKFPEIYQGSYLCESDTAEVRIEENLIILRHEYIFRVAKNTLGKREVCKIEGDTIYIKDINKCYPIRFLNDSIVEGTITDLDTIFEMGPEALVREYKGNIILSQKTKPLEWAIQVLTMDDDFNINLKSITDESDIKAIQKITLAENITLPEDKFERFRLRPTMIEFDELLENKEVFIECDYFIRTNVDELFPWIF